MSKKKAPLEGVRVLEMGRLIAAPMCGQLLGDLGADVIKIERVGAGDDIRGYGPPFLRGKDHVGGSSAFFLACNRNKRSVAIDFSNARGAELVRSLAAMSDVFIENYKVGALAKYQLDEQSIRKVRDDIIYLSVSGFGQSGPYAGRRSTDVIIQGLSGLMSVTGEPDRPPMKVGAPVADMATGLYGALGIVAALYQRTKSGDSGDWVGVSLLDSCMAVMSTGILWTNLTDQPAARLGNSALGSAPSGVYACIDGEILIQAGKDADFVKLCEILGLKDLVLDSRFRTRAARVINEAELFPLLNRAVAKWMRDELHESMINAGIICGPVNDVLQALADPQVVANRVQISAKHPEAPELNLVAGPIKFRDAEGAEVRRYPPRLGEHTESVLTEVLGMNVTEIAELARQRVIGLMESEV